MVKILILKNARIISIDKIISNGWIAIKDKKIFQINSTKYNNDFSQSQVIDCQGKTIIPGFIDLHVHGGYGYSLMDNNILSITNFAKNVTKEGVTKFCYATVTASKTEIDQILTTFGQYMASENHVNNKAKIIGAYLEGPFISSLQKGAHDPSLIHLPEISWVQHWNKLSNNNVKFIVYAPEVDLNFNDQAKSFTTALINNQIIPTIGHSNGTFQVVKQAVSQGLKHVTHLYNGMSPYLHRQPGVVPAALYYDQLVTELICDGIHVDWDILVLTYKIKGADRICLITDAMSAKGLPDGNYLLGKLPVIKKNDRVTLKESGTLAGSITTMITGFKNLLKITNNNWQDCVKMTSYNSAKQVGIAQETGNIACNLWADLVVLDENNDIFLTICEGNIVYESK